MSFGEHRRQAALYGAAGARAQRIVVISESERDHLVPIIDSGLIDVIEHGVDCAYFHPVTDVRQAVDVAALGWLQGASIELARETVLTAHAHGHQWRWRFVGVNSIEVAAPLGDLAEATGLIDDLRPEYHQARVVLVPADAGSGVKTTLLQAWATKRPVVTTSHGLRGLPAQPDENVLVADSPTGLVEAIARLLADESLRERVAEAGYRAVQDRDIGRLAQEFLSVCERTMGSAAS
jgi:glycosyltransferase involved in cell wall biosynthesis